MNGVRYLIVNADDFGLSDGVNAGVAMAHERGILTSASLMVRGAAAAKAARYGQEHPELSLGLHVDLGEWRYVNCEWQIAYQVVPSTDLEAVAGEIHRQLSTFRLLVGRSPTHLDSHQHVHRSEPARNVLRGLARELNVVLRAENGHVRYCGDFYGQSDKGYAYPEGISPERLATILSALPAGITELGCHPGNGTDPASVYNAERAVEVQALCDPRVRAALRAEGIVLRSFQDVRGAYGGTSPTR